VLACSVAIDVLACSVAIDVLACSVAIDGSADVTDIDHLALFIQVVNMNWSYKTGP